MGAGELITKALLEGGPYGIALLGWAAWLWERRQHSETTDRLIELSTAQIEATVKHELAIGANTEVMRRLIDRV